MAYLQIQNGVTTVGITGAQGVGKTTFCNALAATLMAKTTAQVHLSPSIGGRLKELGIPLGSSASADSVAAVYRAHIDRNLERNPGIVLFDRCAVDALAYVRALRVTSDAQTDMYERLTALLVRHLHLVIHLEMRGIFRTQHASHETTSLRADIAQLVPLIISELDLPSITIYAADTDAVEHAAAGILARIADAAALPSRGAC